MTRETPAQLLAVIVSSSDDAIISKNLDGYVTSWSAGAVRLFGYTPEEMIGQHITRSIPLERISQEDYVLSRIRRRPCGRSLETVRRRKDGTRPGSPIRRGPADNVGHRPGGRVASAPAPSIDRTSCG